MGRPVRVQCAHPQLVATLPAPVLASGTIGVGWVGRGRGRGALASGSSCVASQGRHHRMSWSWKGSAVGPSRRYERRRELLPLLGAPGCGRGSRRRHLTPAVDGNPWKLDLDYETYFFGMVVMKMYQIRSLMFLEK